jgi:hypothetical protein
MRSDHSPAFFALAGLLACAEPTPAPASSCNRVVAVRIEMTPGQACWIYRGAATAFVGDFSHGQRIAAHMMGQASEYDPRSGRVTNFFFFGDAEAPGVLTFSAPTNGTYRLSFSPCAMWGAPGAVKICAH